MPVELCGLKIRGLRKDRLLRSRRLKVVVTLNSQIIVLAAEDVRLRRIINDNCATVDGQAPLWLARALHPGKNIEKISGSDLIYDICAYAAKAHESVFLLGGNEASNRNSIAALKLRYDIRIDGFSPPHSPYPFPEEITSEINQQLRASRPTFVLVGFGCPKQEYWLEDNKGLLLDCGVRLAVGVGGTFELTAGQLRRAPQWIQNCGMEWVYRLLQEPRRLWLRYAITNPIFVALAIMSLLKPRRTRR